MVSEACWRPMAAVRTTLLIFLLRFRADEDDADDDLVEEHVTKVGGAYRVGSAKRCCQTCVTVIGVGKCPFFFFRFTTAAARTPSWPSSSTRFKRVPSATTSAWSRWGPGRYPHTHTHTPVRHRSTIRSLYLPVHNWPPLTTTALQNLCINEEVRRLGSVQRINDRCMEMQKNKRGESPRLALAPAISYTHLPSPHQRGSIPRTGRSASAARRGAPAPTTKPRPCRA